MILNPRSMIACTLLCLNYASLAQFVPTEIVYQNSKGDVEAVHSRLGEYGDELILGGDNRKILSFEFEYYGNFTPSGDETCVLRFYQNDGDSLVSESKAPGTLLYESAPFTIFPDYNTATIRNMEVEVPDKFTWTVDFQGLSGLSTDRCGLLMRNPPSIGDSFDDFWVLFGNGWGPWRFNGDPVANFACRATAEFDLSIRYQALERSPNNKPFITIQGPRNQTIIVYASNDKFEWQPIALETLTDRILKIEDEGVEPGQTRYYRSTLMNNTSIRMDDFEILENGRTRLSVTGPRGLPFSLQASDDFVEWENVLSLAFQTRPIVAQDAKATGKAKRFYRMVLNNVVGADPDALTDTIIEYPKDFSTEEE